jgi:hypothetical protein
MGGETERSKLEARVYSRAGADDPRAEHVDPLTGRHVWVTDSEWQLLQDDLTDSPRHGTGDLPGTARATSTHPELADANDTDRIHPSSRATRRRERRRVPTPVAVAAGIMAGAALVAAWMWAGDASQRSPDVHIQISPSPQPEANAWEPPPDAAFDIFRDPDHSQGSLPGWLTDLFPASRIAQLVGPTGPIRGAGVYAAVSHYAIACLVVRLDANGMVWNCTSLEHVASDGMTLRTPIPADLATGRDGDGDGVAGDAVHSDLLVVEWHADGTFLVTRTDG